MSSSPSLNIDEKIMNDLNVVNDKIDVCDTMLKNKVTGEYDTTIPKYDALLNLIGFLEACTPRMIELVEAAAQGVLSDSVLMKCLEVNDRLTKILSDIDKITFTDSLSAATAAGGAEPDLFLTEEISTSSAGQTSSAAHTSKTPDNFDDFDAFLNERANNSSGNLGFS